MCRLLRRRGFKYIKGEKRHYIAESAANVAYRATYLQRKLLNRDKTTILSSLRSTLLNPTST
eukprot:jgi/Phyca11/124253/e_gw1.53.404.1